MFGSFYKNLGFNSYFQKYSIFNKFLETYIEKINNSMDNYQYEPVTKGKIILHTSFGDIDIELWPKEAPMAVRNFVQLGLEGYYDGTIFHRIVKDLLIQGGDPTGTGDGNK